MVSGATKSYMKKGFLIYEEAVSHICMTLHPIPLNFLIYKEDFILFFINVLNFIPTCFVHCLNGLSL